MAVVSVDDVLAVADPLAARYGARAALEDVGEVTGPSCRELVASLLAGSGNGDELAVELAGAGPGELVLRDPHLVGVLHGLVVERRPVEGEDALEGKCACGWAQEAVVALGPADSAVVAEALLWRQLLTVHGLHAPAEPGPQHLTAHVAGPVDVDSLAVAVEAAVRLVAAAASKALGAGAVASRQVWLVEPSHAPAVASTALALARDGLPYGDVRPHPAPGAVLWSWSLGAGVRAL